MMKAIRKERQNKKKIRINSSSMPDDNVICFMCIIFFPSKKYQQQKKSIHQHKAKKYSGKQATVKITYILISFRYLLTTQMTQKITKTPCITYE